MANVLSQCIKCNCSLSVADKIAKLLPCLHTLCEDCLSGRTAVTERRKKLPQEPEEEKNLEETPVAETPQETEHANDVRDETTKADDNETDADDTENMRSKERDDGETESHVRNDGETEDAHVEVTEQCKETSMEEVTPPDPVPLTECPMCKEPFVTESLIDNVFTRKKTPVSDPGTQKEQTCTGCDSNVAASYCAQCDDWLCADCVNAHKRVRMTKDHQLSSLDEAAASKACKDKKVTISEDYLQNHLEDLGVKSTEDGLAAAELTLLCKDHPKEKLTLFCEKCEVLTCRDCQLLQHQEHKYHFLQDAADTYKVKLKGSLSLMKDRRKALQKCLTEIEERLDKVKKEKNSLQQEILHQADIVVKAVRASVWSVLSSLHSFTEAASKRLSREVGDVGDLVGKFDHCINFMEAILEDGFGSSLLYSKTFVEGKCRKVYHTQMEPQSLKGPLKLQYRHDVPVVLSLLPNLGAIYVNGTKYPPEKMQPSSGASSGQNTTAYKGSSAGGAITLPHLAVSQNRGSYVQVAMNLQAQQNATPLVVPSSGSRQVVGLPPGSRGWAGAQVAVANSQNAGMTSLMVPGVIVPQQPQRVVAQGSVFPAMAMKLHQRPVEASVVMSVAAGSHTSQLKPGSAFPMHLRSILPAPTSNITSGPPPYPASADGTYVNSGNQGAMSLVSGVRRAGTALDPVPDPARPASGGRNTPDRPLSSEGAAAGARMKSEHSKNEDCVITAASFKGVKSSSMVAATLGEMQKNLDDVIRSVPLDLSDNLEPISGSNSITDGSSSIKTTVPTPTSPPESSPSANGASVTSFRSGSKDMEPSTAVDSAAPASVESKHSESGSEEEEEASTSDMTQDSVVSSDDHQVKGYATGNSMPGFALGVGGPLDPNDDYCAVCHQGGDVLCCDKCPRVFHLQCHVPVLSVVPSGAFVCTLCEGGLVLERSDESAGDVVGGKRKAPTGLSDRDLRVCERILLELFCHPSSIPFHEPVNRAVPNYYKIITSPMDFTNIKCKLSRSHFNHYATVESFLDDCSLVFGNCAVYNAETSEVGKAGELVSQFFEDLVTRHMPDLSSYASCPARTKSVESERKKRRVTASSPPQHRSGGKGK